MRRVPLAIVVLLALVLVAGCAAPAAENASEPAGSSESAAGEAGGDTAQSAWDQLAADYGDTEWHQAITSIDPVVKLRHPVWEVRFDATVEGVRNNGWNNDLMFALAEVWPVQGDGYHVDIYGTDGPAAGGGMGTGESITLPAPPDSVDGMTAWLDEAYGPASGDAVEDWYGHVTGFGFEAEAWDGANVLVVKTDLSDVGFEWSPEREMVDLIRYAVSTAKVTWAENLRIEDATGENLSTGEYRWDMVPYAGY